MEDRQGQIEAAKRYGIARMKLETEKMEPLLLFGRAFADPMRIRILGLLAKRSMYGQELAEALHVQPPTISHHLTSLKAAGLIDVRRENNYHHYQLNEDSLCGMAGLLTVENLQRIAERLPTENSVAPPTIDEERQLVESAFFKEGRLINIPTHSQPRRFVIEKIATVFEWGHLYTEKEVNEFLKTFHDDTATLRRELIEQKMMMRENGRYWLIRPHE